MNDEQLKRAMHDVAGSIAPPVNDLVQGGIARGDRMRRRHTTNVAVGTLAVVVAATGAAFAVPQLADRPDTVATDEDDARMDIAAPAEPTTSGAATRSGEPTTEGPTGEPFTDELVVETVLGLLPPGEVTDVQTFSQDELAVPFQLVYDDGDGRSVIMGSASVTPHGTSLETDVSSTECGVVVNGGDCDTQTLDDGTVLTVRTGPYYPQPDREPERLHWSAHARRPDGLTIMIGAINAPTEKDSQISREEPALSVDQLSAIVTSDQWPRIDEEVLDAAAERDRQEEAEREQDEARERAQRMPHGEELAADLGPGWVANTEDGMWGTATPSAALAERLPDGYEHAVVVRDVFTDTEPDEVCGEGGVEKGLETEPCAQWTSDGSTVHTTWARSVVEGGYNEHPDASLEDSVTVLHSQDDGTLVRVQLSVAEPNGTSTAQRRADAVSWLEEQVNDVVRAATVGGLGTDDGTSAP